MDIIGQISHSLREGCWIGLNCSIWVPGVGPAVIDVEIFVTSLKEAGRDHCVSNLHGDFFVDSAVEVVPAVPTHGWGESLAVVEGVGAQNEDRKSKEGLHIVGTYYVIYINLVKI